MLTIDRTLASRKSDILSYFRDRASESLEEITRTSGSNNYKELASKSNSAITASRGSLITTLLQTATRERWNNGDTLRCVLMITYCSYVVMLETRNDVWPYDYMAFSRRMGELWEPFCKLCFEYPSKELSLFVPPLFADVKRQLASEIEAYIDALPISVEQKLELRQYYGKVWTLVGSGEVKLELDLHFELGGEKIVIDFKSGFGSNEKGNTNRLLLVASVYKNLEANYRCVILVCSAEERNNSYFQTLKRSAIWEAYCGDEAYTKIYEFSGFNMRDWIHANVHWESDFKPMMMKHLVAANLEHYLNWC